MTAREWATARAVEPLAQRLAAERASWLRLRIVVAAMQHGQVRLTLQTPRRDGTWDTRGRLALPRPQAELLVAFLRCGTGEAEGVLVVDVVGSLRQPERHRAQAGPPIDGENEAAVDAVAQAGLARRFRERQARRLAGREPAAGAGPA